MSKWMVGIALGLALGFAGTVEARAQTPYELNIHGGAFFPDDDASDDTEGMIGARIFLHKPSGWGFGGNFDYVPRQGEIGDDDEVDINTYLYSGELNYTFPSSSKAKFFVGAGIGAATTKVDFEDDSDDSSTDLLVPLGAGLKWDNRATDPSWAIRGDVRDNIIFAEEFDPDEGDEDKKATNNIELSGGVSFYF